MPVQDTIATTTSPISSSLPAHLSTRSPRSSLDSSPRTPNSPFLQNLSNRFRKGSNASNYSQASEQPTSQSFDPTERSDTAQSAKRHILNVIRNDWEWPVEGGATMTGGENNTQDEKKQEIMLTDREPVGWRTRFEGASDLDLDLSPVSLTGRRKSKRSSDPYKFESPDAIASSIQEQRLKVKRANMDETTWNEGLRFWSQRRDAWTSAQPQKPRKRSFEDFDGSPRPHSPFRYRTHHKTSRSSEDSKHSRQNNNNFRRSSVPNTNGRTQPSSSRHHSIAVDDSSVNEHSDSDGLTGPYLPIFPPLFPTSHTLRARIKPAAYPTIYSKVVLQSLAPNVPIPLTHMIGALVDGWKSEGNWPPQTLEEQKTHALLKRARGSQKGETAFQKWRKEREAERQYVQHTFQDGFEAEMVVLGDEEGRKRGFRKSISGAVKKVLGMRAEVEEDGGLARLGLEFSAEGPGGGQADGDGVGNDHAAEVGLMRESVRVAEDNAELNKGLLENGNGGGVKK